MNLDTIVEYDIYPCFDPHRVVNVKTMREYGDEIAEIAKLFIKENDYLFYKDIFSFTKIEGFQE